MICYEAKLMCALFAKIPKNAAHGRKTRTKKRISQQNQAFPSDPDADCGAPKKKNAVRILLFFVTGFAAFGEAFHFAGVFDGLGRVGRL